MQIKAVDIQDILYMRQSIMYPDQSLDFVKLENDGEGLHRGLYVHNELVSVISLFVANGEVQFRKFATQVALQGRGYGSTLLQHVFDWAAQNGLKRIWCNARVNASGFYGKFGMQPVGDTWQKYGFDFVKMEKYL